MNCIATLCFALLLPVSVSAETAMSGMAQVIDGDTILLGPTPVRIHGIDAPEQGQPRGGTWPCGDHATQKMAELAQDRRITCAVRDHDRYGRVIARCEVDGIDLGAAMMEAGLAWAFRQFSTDYLPHEARASAARIGIWSSDNQPPWVYRAARWDRAAAEAPDNCPIKGNINRQGERIYHTPWSPWYSRTVIDVASGERWFCDEGEVVAAGWRRRGGGRSGRKPDLRRSSIATASMG